MTRFLRSIVMSAALILAAALPARAADEVAFLNLWQQHLAAEHDPARAIAACDKFEANNPGDSFIVVARQLKAWHLIKQGHHTEARELLAPMVKSGVNGLDRGASDIARGWLTRFDREIVKAALQKIYTRDVAYPERLSLWTASTAGAPPLVDRWGRNWDYRLIGFSRLPGLHNQKYELRSPLLGDRSDLATALAAPYATDINLRPIKVVSGSSGPALVQFEAGPGGTPVTLAVGTRHDSILFTTMGRQLIVLSDYTHWKVLPKPNR